MDLSEIRGLGIPSIETDSRAMREKVLRLVDRMYSRRDKGRNRVVRMYYSEEWDDKGYDLPINPIAVGCENGTGEWRLYYVEWFDKDGKHHIQNKLLGKVKRIEFRESEEPFKFDMGKLTGRDSNGK